MFEREGLGFNPMETGETVIPESDKIPKVSDEDEEDESDMMHEPGSFKEHSSDEIPESAPIPKEESAEDEE